jgi:DNA (cytosine-5)-methyltransferase 1
LFNYKVTEFGQIRESLLLSVKEAAQLLGKSERTIYRWEKGEATPNPRAIYELETLYNVQSNNISPKKPLFRFIDLFAGIGGLRQAFVSIGGECVFTSEWDSACRTTYQANYRCDHPVEGDIRSVALDEIPYHDVLVAGFPCQPFSIAGVSKKNSLGTAHGFRDDTQGTLFFDLAQIIEHHRPKAFLLENVKNLKSHDKGNTLKVIVRTLTEELGYKVDYRIIDSKGWLPQHRERIFIVGFREDVDFSFDFIKVADKENGPKLHTILHPEDGTELEELPYTTGEKALVADKYTLSDKLWQYLQNYAAKHKAKGNGFGYGLVGPHDTARTLSARYYKDGSEILIKQDGKNPRRLTPRECARLMGFDEKGGDSFIIPVSDTQSYKQFGNSVAVPVVKAVARHMLPHLLQLMRKEGSHKNNSEQLSLIKTKELV